MRINIDLQGLREVRNMTEEVRNRLMDEVDAVTERRAMKLVNDARADAPRKTGKLANGLDIIDQHTEKGVRVIGTEVEYTQRQEYEHKTKKGFIRNNVNKHKPLYEQDIKDAVDRITGGA